jgi:hypothetical protein
MSSCWKDIFDMDSNSELCNQQLIPIFQGTTSNTSDVELDKERSSSFNLQLSSHNSNVSRCYSQYLNVHLLLNLNEIILTFCFGCQCLQETMVNRVPKLSARNLCKTNDTSTRITLLPYTKKS